jgi:hypothetical protein
MATLALQARDVTAEARTATEKEGDHVQRIVIAGQAYRLRALAALAPRTP